MTAAGRRFICSDPDVGELGFGDVDAVLDALEAALIDPTTPLFDAVRQSRQAVGLHPEVRAAWEARLRFRPPAGPLTLPEPPSITALVRSLPPAPWRAEVSDAPVGPTLGSRDRGGEGRRPGGGRRAILATLLAAALLLLAVGWVVLAVAGRVTSLAAGAIGLRAR
jgi:hypothetical protein